MEASAGLVDRGFAIVSGGAYGIDGMAHRAALASDGTTIAFLAGGIDRFYPLGHESLLTRIAQTGAVVSELPCGAAPTKWRFLQRNRLIAAASQATVVLEAGIRSGSLNTAGHAAALGRPLGAVPGPVTSPASAGCHRLLREFDAMCVVDADQMAELATAGPGRTTVARTSMRRVGPRRGPTSRTRWRHGCGGGAPWAAGGERSRGDPRARCDEHAHAAGAVRRRRTRRTRGDRGDVRPRPARGRWRRRATARGMAAPTCRMNARRDRRLPIGWRLGGRHADRTARQVSGGEPGHRARQRHPSAARGSTPRRASRTRSGRWARWWPSSPAWATPSTPSS